MNPMFNDLKDLQALIMIILFILRSKLVAIQTHSRTQLSMSPFHPMSQIYGVSNSLNVMWHHSELAKAPSYMKIPTRTEEQIINIQALHESRDSQCFYH